MSEILKVNSKTSILEFKRKFNKLVENANKLPVEIIEWDETRPITLEEFEKLKTLKAVLKVGKSIYLTMKS